MSQIKHAKLKLNAPLQAEKIETLKKILTREMGVLHIEFVPRKRLLELAYNFEVTTLAQIENVVEQHGLKLCRSLGWRFRRGYIHFTEQNEWENARRPKTTCSGQPGAMLKNAARLKGNSDREKTR